MNESKRDRCQPCEGGVQPLDREQVEAKLEDLPGWRLDADGQSIVRDFRFEGFQATMRFVNALAAMAEAQGHHPDFCAGYGYCKVRYTTHAIGGLSDNDLICAALASELTES